MDKFEKNVTQFFNWKKALSKIWSIFWISKYFKTYFIIHGWTPFRSIIYQFKSQNQGFNFNKFLDPKSASKNVWLRSGWVRAISRYTAQARQIVQSSSLIQEIRHWCKKNIQTEVTNLCQNNWHYHSTPPAVYQVNHKCELLFIIMQSGVCRCLIEENLEFKCRCLLFSLSVIKNAHTRSAKIFQQRGRRNEHMVSSV